MSLSVKICGFTEATTLQTAVEAGVDLVGFVFHPPSKRFIEREQARKLAGLVPPSVKKVGLFAGATDEQILTVTTSVKLDLLQLHGNESPKRAAEIRTLTGLPLIMAFPIASAEDFNRVPAYEPIADWFLFDTKTTTGSSGGTGARFDWTLLKNRSFARPWMLAGGLDLHNLAEALAKSGAKAVDLSSGLEDHPGQKSVLKIIEFMRIAKDCPA